MLRLLFNQQKLRQVCGSPQKRVFKNSRYKKIILKKSVSKKAVPVSIKTWTLIKSGCAVFLLGLGGLTLYCYRSTLGSFFSSSPSSPAQQDQPKKKEQNLEPNRDDKPASPVPVLSSPSIPPAASPIEGASSSNAIIQKGVQKNKVLKIESLYVTTEKELYREMFVAYLWLQWALSPAMEACAGNVSDWYHSYHFRRLTLINEGGVSHTKTMDVIHEIHRLLRYQETNLGAREQIQKALSTDYTSYPLGVIAKDLKRIFQITVPLEDLESLITDCLELKNAKLWCFSRYPIGNGKDKSTITKELESNNFS